MATAPPPAQVVLCDHRLLPPEAWQALLRLQVSPAQLDFAGPLERALARCEAGPPEEVVGLAILAEGVVCGHLVLSCGAVRPDWAGVRCAALSAMRIDLAQQGRGLGTQALRALPGWLARHWPQVQRVALCVDEANLAARRAYEQAGFAAVGPTQPGRIGPVQVMLRTL